ncbi:MORN repeat containing 2 [Branchiostoma belcheri]|nr:MORN repeat containing 2 [Branchiostoma belcheri]
MADEELERPPSTGPFEYRSDDKHVTSGSEFSSMSDSSRRESPGPVFGVNLDERSLLERVDSALNRTGPPLQKGVYIFPNGDKYDGEYSQSDTGVLERNGVGTHTTKDGVVYTGRWVQDKMSGQGKLVHPSGAVYDGEFYNNTFHGRGKYIWPDGSFYEGNWEENKMEGDGEFIDTEGQTWTGTFRHRAAPGLRFKLNLEI